MQLTADDIAVHQVRVDQKGAQGFPQRLSEGHVQVDEAPIDALTQLQVVAFYFPKVVVVQFRVLDVFVIIPIITRLVKEFVTEIGAQGITLIFVLHQPPHQLGHAHVHMPLHEHQAGRQGDVVQLLGQDAQVLAVPFVRDPKLVVEPFTLRLGFFHLVKLRFAYEGFHQTHPIHHAGIVGQFLDLDGGLIVDRGVVGPQIPHQLDSHHEHARVDGRRESRKIHGRVGGGDGRQPHLPSFPLQCQRHG